MQLNLIGIEYRFLNPYQYLDNNPLISEVDVTRCFCFWCMRHSLISHDLCIHAQVCVYVYIHDSTYVVYVYMHTIM